MTTTTRFDHSNCDHAKSGNEGKKARAKCRKAHAELAAKAAEAKKPVRKPRAATARKAPAKKPVEAKVVDLSNVDDLVEA